jgi:DNA-binding HxlR family transcriptional regulator
MLGRTRQVLSLLGDELNGQLLEACSDGNWSESELRDLTGASHATLTTRLQLLEARGLLHRSEARGPRGRPATTWTALGHDQLLRFGQTADQFVLDLLQAQVTDQEDGIHARARAGVRRVSEDAPDPVE